MNESPRKHHMREMKMMGPTFPQISLSDQNKGILNLCVGSGNFVIPESPKMFEVD